VEHTTDGRSLAYYALLRVGVGERLPTIQMPIPEIHRKTTEVKGLKIQQVMFAGVRVPNSPWLTEY